MIKVNGSPIELVEPEMLRIKCFEPVLLLGQHRFANVDIRVRVKGGGKTAQIYAIRQAISKSLVAYYQKCRSNFNELSILTFGTQLLMSEAKMRSKRFSSRTTALSLWQVM